MATRMYCDQCGNTIRKSTKASCYIGPALDYTHATTMNYPAYPSGGGMGNAANIGNGLYMATPAIPVPASPFLAIDLCDTCVVSWPERVKNLTRVSEPDAKTS